MNNLKLLLLYFFIFNTSIITGQSSGYDISTMLEEIFEKILVSKNDSEKLRLNDSVRLLIDEYIMSDSVFDHRFTNLKYLGQIDSPDEKIKMVTWNIPLREGPNMYFLYLIKRDTKKSGKKVFRLEGVNRPEKIRNDTIYTESNWYGALYYDIRPFRNEKETCYILLGLDTDNLYMSRKIIEVLSFGENGEIIFGRPCFIRDNENRFREVLEYSAEGLVSLRMGSNKLIVFDRLDAFATGHSGDNGQYGAGIALDGYRLKKGYWNFVEDVDIKKLK
ncbi:MAG TPA: hypothetical protein PLR52_07435 [Bacteroidales bacterium]|nr:hypothetical protein [Bacteroidales bacterium]HPI69154.1 hypothetical protein [Bacteroidales bacterium]